MNNSPQAFTNYRGVNQGGNFNETKTLSDRYATPTGVQDARLGADFQVSKNTVIGVLGGFMDRNWDMKATNATKYSKNGNLQNQSPNQPSPKLRQRACLGRKSERPFAPNKMVGYAKQYLCEFDGNGFQNSRQTNARKSRKNG